MPKRVPEPFIRLSVNFADDPKIRAVSDAACMVFIRSIAYAKRTGSDGYLTRTCLELLGNRPRTHAKALVDLGLWTPEGDGYRIVAYDRWQETTDEIAQARKAGAERQRRSRSARTPDVTRDNPADEPAASRVTDTTYIDIDIDKSKNKTVSDGAIASRRAAPRNPQASAQELLAEWLDHEPQRPPRRIVGHIAKTLKELLGEGQPYELVRAGLAEWSRSDSHPATLPSYVHRATKNRNRKSTTDERVTGALALAEKYDKLDGTGK
jgi:hypothetical protein